MRYYLDTRSEFSYIPSPISLMFVYSPVYMKLTVVLQSAVVKVVSDLPSDELSADGISFLIYANNELAEMSVSF